MDEEQDVSKIPDNQGLSGGQLRECDDKIDELIYTEDRLDIDKPIEGNIEKKY